MDDAAGSDGVALGAADSDGDAGAADADGADEVPPPQALATRATSATHANSRCLAIDEIVRPHR
jgi:hypothetical protein